VNTTIKINRRAAGYYEFETTNGTHTIARLELWLAGREG